MGDNGKYSINFNQSNRRDSNSSQSSRESSTVSSGSPSRSCYITNQSLNKNCVINNERNSCNSTQSYRHPSKPRDINDSRNSGNSTTISTSNSNLDLTNRGVLKNWIRLESERELYEKLYDYGVSSEMYEQYRFNRFYSKMLIKCLTQSTEEISDLESYLRQRAGKKRVFKKPGDSDEEDNKNVDIKKAPLKSGPEPGVAERNENVAKKKRGLTFKTESGSANKSKSMSSKMKKMRIAEERNKNMFNQDESLNRFLPAPHLKFIQKKLATLELKESHTNIITFENDEAKLKRITSSVSTAPVPYNYPKHHNNFLKFYIARKRITDMDKHLTYKRPLHQKV